MTVLTPIEFVFRIKNSWYLLCPMGMTWVLQWFLFKRLSSNYWVPNLSVWQYPSEASFPVNPKYDKGWALQGQKAISVSQRTWKDKKTKTTKKDTEKTERHLETKWHKYKKINKRPKMKKKKKKRDMTTTEWFTDKRYFVSQSLLLITEYCLGQGYTVINHVYPLILENELHKNTRNTKHKNTMNTTPDNSAHPYHFIVEQTLAFCALCPEKTNGFVVK